MAKLLKGAPVAEALSEALIVRTARLKAAGVSPALAIIRVGDRTADISYERGATKRCEKVGISVKRIMLDATCKKKEVLDAVRSVNDDPSIHGCMMFRPLPDKNVEAEVAQLLSPAKDIDGFTSGSLGDVFIGRAGGFPPCTAQACIEILDYYGYKVKSANVTVVGASLVIGKPVALMLLNRFATLDICHIDTIDTASHCRKADILISAAGCAGLITKDFVSSRQVVLDVGINTDAAGKLCGDVAFDEVEPIVSAITPVPGGIGAVTSAVLAKHVVEAAERSLEN